MQLLAKMHPAMLAILESFKDLPALDLATTPIDVVRSSRGAFNLPAPNAPLHDVRDLHIPGPTGPMAARLYRATDAAAAPVMVYLHGGGWCLGSIETHHGLCYHLALLTGMNVLSIDYRLAPEHPFPAPLDDCYAAVRWAADNASSIHSDAQALTVAGDSAGGNLALAVALRAKEEGWGGIRQQLLIYPAVDMAMDTPSAHTCETPMLDRAGMAWMWNAYHPTQPVHSLASMAHYPDVSGLPPTVMVLAELDVLHDEGLAMAQRLQQAGVPTVVQEAPGMPHGFANFSAMVPDIACILQDVAQHLLQQMTAEAA